jgi:hypothetical protein
MSSCNHDKCLRDNCVKCCYCNKELKEDLGTWEAYLHHTGKERSPENIRAGRTRILGDLIEEDLGIHPYEAMDQLRKLRSAPPIVAESVSETVKEDLKQNSNKEAIELFDKLLKMPDHEFDEYFRKIRRTGVHSIPGSPQEIPRDPKEAREMKNFTFTHTSYGPDGVSVGGYALDTKDGDLIIRQETAAVKSPILDEAIAATVEELNKMPDAEFYAELERHKDGEISQLLRQNVIYAAHDAWHRLVGKPYGEIYEFLGWTWDEYAKWVGDATAIPPSLVGSPAQMIQEAAAFLNNFGLEFEDSILKSRVRIIKPISSGSSSSHSADTCDDPTCSHL